MSFEGICFAPGVSDCILRCRMFWHLSWRLSGFKRVYGPVWGMLCQREECIDGYISRQGRARSAKHAPAWKSPRETQRIASSLTSNRTHGSQFFFCFCVFHRFISFHHVTPPARSDHVVSAILSAYLHMLREDNWKWIIKCELSEVRPADEAEECEQQRGQEASPVKMCLRRSFWMRICTKIEFGCQTPHCDAGPDYNSNRSH